MVDDTADAVWTDDQIQDTLDEHKLRVQREYMEMEKTLVSASDYEYRIYHSRYGSFEEGGTAYFNIEAANGEQRAAGTYTADYVRGVVTMSADQAGSALYLTGWSYDLNGAAADCWRERAAKVSSYYNVDADGHRLSRSQWFDHCQDMAEMYARRERAITVRAWRHGLFGDN